MLKLNPFCTLKDMAQLGIHYKQIG